MVASAGRQPTASQPAWAAAQYSPSPRAQLSTTSGSQDRPRRPHQRSPLAGAPAPVGARGRRHRHRPLGRPRRCRRHRRAPPPRAGRRRGAQRPPSGRRPGTRPPTVTAPNRLPGLTRQPSPLRTPFKPSRRHERIRGLGRGRPTAAEIARVDISAGGGARRRIGQRALQGASGVRARCLSCLRHGLRPPRRTGDGLRMGTAVAPVGGRRAPAWLAAAAAWPGPPGPHGPRRRGAAPRSAAGAARRRPVRRPAPPWAGRPTALGAPRAGLCTGIVRGRALAALGSSRRRMPSRSSACRSPVVTSPGRVTVCWMSPAPKPRASGCAFGGAAQRRRAFRVSRSSCTVSATSSACTPGSGSSTRYASADS